MGTHGVHRHPESPCLWPGLDFQHAQFIRIFTQVISRALLFDEIAELCEWLRFSEDEETDACDEHRIATTEHNHGRDSHHSNPMASPRFASRCFAILAGGQRQVLFRPLVASRFFA